MKKAALILFAALATLGDGAHAEDHGAKIAAGCTALSTFARSVAEAKRDGAALEEVQAVVALSDPGATPEVLAAYAVVIDAAFAPDNAVLVARPDLFGVTVGTACHLAAGKPKEEI